MAHKKITTKSQKPRSWIYVIWLLGFVIYAATLDNPFVFDDIAFIQENGAFQKADKWSALIFQNPSRALTMLSFGVNHGLHQYQTAGYHWVNLLLHLLAATAVWWLIGLFLSLNGSAELSVQKRWISLLGGLIFVAHPLQTQAVSYVWQRAAVLATVFYLLSLGCYILARTALIEEQPKKRVQLYWLASLGFGFCGFFSKEISYTLPLTIAFAEWFFFGKSKRAPLYIYLSYLLLLALGPLTLLASREIYREMLLFAAQVQDPLPAYHYLLTQLSVILTYLRLAFLPVGQNFDYDFPVTTSLGQFSAWFPLLILLGILALIFRLYGRRRLLAFAILWFFLAMGVEAAAYSLPDVIFEHRAYLSMAAFSMFIPLLLTELPTGFDKVPRLWLMGLVLPLAFLTFQRNKVWDQAYGLWDDVVRKSPQKARPWVNRGLASKERGDLAEALADFSQALRVDPNFEQAYMARAVVLQGLGENGRALSDYHRVLDLNPADHAALNNRGAVLTELGRLDEAEADLNRALTLKQNYAKAFNNRGRLRLKQKKVKQALADFSKAIEREPGNGEFYFNRARALEKRGDLEEAIADYQQAVAKKALYKDAYLNLAALCYRRGRREEALNHLGAALALDKDFLEAYLNRGSIYFNDGDYRRALTDFDRALSIEPRAQVYYSRGLTFLYLEQLPAARADLETAQKMGIPIPQAVRDRLREPQNLP